MTATTRGNKNQRRKQIKVNEVSTTVAEQTPVETPVEIVMDNPTPTKDTQKQTRNKRITLDKDELIECRAGVSNLTYISKRTSEKFEWNEYGDINYLTVGELISMKSSYPRFFTEGWLIIDDEEVIEQLGLLKMYGNVHEIDSIDELFELDDTELTRILSNLPRGFKKNLGFIARKKLQNGELDSRNLIKILEKHLEIDLKIFE